MKETKRLAICLASIHGVSVRDLMNYEKDLLKLGANLKNFKKKFEELGVVFRVSTCFDGVPALLEIEVRNSKVSYFRKDSWNYSIFHFGCSDILPGHIKGGLELLGSAARDSFCPSRAGCARTGWEEL